LPGKSPIARIARDAGTGEVADWVYDRREQLADRTLVGSGDTGLQVLGRWRELALEPLLFGRRGADQQIGTRIAEGRVDAPVFFIDPLFDVKGADPPRRCGKKNAVCVNLLAPIALFFVGN
jgi:methylglyoxal synthase